MEIKTSSESMATLMLALHKLIGSTKLEHILQNSMGNTLTGLNVIALKILCSILTFIPGQSYIPVLEIYTVGFKNTYVTLS